MCTSKEETLDFNLGNNINFLYLYTTRILDTSIEIYRYGF